MLISVHCYWHFTSAPDKLQILRDQSQLYKKSFTVSHNRPLDQFQNMRITVTTNMKKELDTQLDEGIVFCSAA